MYIYISNAATKIDLIEKLLYLWDLILSNTEQKLIQCMVLVMKASSIYSTYSGHLRQQTQVWKFKILDRFRL